MIQNMLKHNVYARINSTANDSITTLTIRLAYEQLIVLSKSIKLVVLLNDMSEAPKIVVD